MKPPAPAGASSCGPCCCGSPGASTSVARTPRRLLVTAGPTHEPIDAVRFIGNRSSGRLGVSLAEEAAREGWTVTLLLGPTPVQPSDSRVTVHRFRTTADLQALLMANLGSCDVLVMAAAVADYRPKINPDMLASKNRRVEGGMTIELESTPDLLAGCAIARRADQVIVGFALEPREEMEMSARRKLAKKKVDLIVANPLATMDAPTIEATVFGTPESGLERGQSTPGPIPKEEFAGWLLRVVDQVRAKLVGPRTAGSQGEISHVNAPAPDRAAVGATPVLAEGSGREQAGSGHGRGR